jgi:hypothetical protein
MRKKSIIIFISFSFLFFLTASAFASSVYFEPEDSEISPGRTFKVDFFIDSAGRDINAIEGKVVFAPEILELREIAEGGSIVAFWVEKPRAESENQIVFSGGFPGGFSEEKGLIFSMLFRARENSSAMAGEIAAANVRAFLNDGSGTSVDIFPALFEFKVADGRKAEVKEEETIINDTNPPELFVPYIGRNPTVFNNQWFVAFAAQDKELGISHYEVWESVQKYDINNISNISSAEWTEARSPFLLKDQKLRSYIYVKAVDKAGNERVAAMLPGKKKESASRGIMVVAAVAVLLVILILFFRRRIFGAFQK